MFSVEKLKNLKEEDVASFGREKLEIFIGHYGCEKMYLTDIFPAIINPEEIRNERRIMKYSICNHHMSYNKRNTELWAIVYADFNEKFPNIEKLFFFNQRRESSLNITRVLWFKKIIDFNQRIK